MIKKRKAAYIWTREHSPRRLQSLEKIRKSWAILFNEEEFGHYQPIQYLPLKHMNNSKIEFDTVLNGKSTRINLKVFTTREWFIREVYNKANELTRLRYPDYDSHYFIDGDRIGERRIKFHSERHALSRYHLISALLWVINNYEPKIKVNESQDSKLYISKDKSKPVLNYLVIRHLDEIDHNIISQIASEIKTYGHPILSDTFVDFSWDDIKNSFTELSEPELVYLNWEKAKPSFSEADIALINAASNLNINAVQQALADGANPNTMDGENTILSSVITAWKDYVSSNSSLEKVTCHKKNNLISFDQVKELMRLLLDAGANPDWYSPRGVNPLTEAALLHQSELAGLLLEYDADAAINCFIDNGITYPSAWDYVVTDGFVVDESREARELFYEMVRHRSTPFFSQLKEDHAQLDATLSDEKRSWWK